MPNIETFKGQFKNLARMNRFKVEVIGLDTSLKYFAKGANLPGTNVPAMDVPYQGRVVKLDGDRVYEPFEMTVYGDEKMKIRKQIEAWMLTYNNPITNVGTLVKTEAFVSLMNRDGSVNTKFILHGCVITNVASVAMDWGSNDQPLEFNVTIDYDYHLIVS